MKKHLRILLLTISICFGLIGCSEKEFDYVPINDSEVYSSNLNERSKVSVVALGEDSEYQIMKLVKRGYSNYGYIQLDAQMQEAYKTIEYALLNLEEKVAISDEVFEKFNTLLRYISSDNPLFFWEPNEITYTPRVGGGYVMNFKYNFTKEEVFQFLTEIDDYANDYCNSIPAGLSNFDKALLVHDKVVTNIVYDKTLSNEWRNDVYGGLINHYASCLGYSKTYQYLMCRLSIDTLMAYGYGGEEQHAWNVINLDGKYYHVDTTFNDSSKTSEIIDGYSKVQHEYTFLCDAEITKTHDILSEEFGSYKLPECDSTQKNYYRMKDLMVSSKSMDTVNSDIDEALSNAISVALADKNSILEIRFEDEEIGKEVIRTIENGELDSRVKMLSKLRGIGNVESRSYTAKNGVLTYYFS